MAKFKEYKTGSDHNVVINLSDYLSADHLCKQMEKIISGLDTSAIEASYSDLGQNALHPKLMLGIIFYGYAVGIRSGRKLAEACQEQLPFIYMSKSYRPKKSCINDFRKNNYQHFSDLFIQVLKKCQESGLGDASFSIVDGSKKEANSAKRRTKTKEQYEKWQQTLLEDIASLEKELSDSEEVKKKLAAKKQLHKKISEAIEVLTTDDSMKTLNLTDPDAPIMKGKKGYFDTNYNIQVGCSEDQIITYNDVVTDGNDKAQLTPALEGIQANTGQDIETALADADFGTFDSLEYMHCHNICGYVPYRNMNATFEDQPFHSSHFDYDVDRDIYICPAEQVLEFKSIKKDKSRDQQYRQYRTKACKDCPFKKECTPKKSTYRTIYREVRQELREQMKRRLNSEEGKKIYARRLHPIEAIFGHLKYNLGYTRFLLRGLEKVKAEFNLMCLAYNLKKLAKHLLCQLLRLKSASFWRSGAHKIVSYPIFQRTWMKRLKETVLFLYIMIFRHAPPVAIAGQPVRLCAS
jgi:transposase